MLYVQKKNGQSTGISLRMRLKNWTPLVEETETGLQVDAELNVKVVPGAAPGRKFVGVAAT